METIEPSDVALPGTEHELNFLLVRDTSDDWPRWKVAFAGTLIFHLFSITALFLIKGGSYEVPPPERLYVPHITRLYVPKELTQKAPSKGPVAKLLLSPTVAPAPKMTEPPPKAAPAPAPPKPAPTPVQAQTPQPKPPAPTPPPQQQQPVETAKTQPPPSTPPPAPAVQKAEPPKMIVEDSLQARGPAPKPNPTLAISTNPVQDALRSLSGAGAPKPRNQVGDSDDIGAGSGVNLPPSVARRSNLSLKSDPMGVDFYPYLLQVLQAVRTNWFAVFPEAARLGQRGQVVVEFSIAKDGVVAKVVFAGQSGAKALDQAAVAAISASNPLPPLPKEFKGDRIVLSMSFMYNMPK